MNYLNLLTLKGGRLLADVVSGFFDFLFIGMNELVLAGLILILTFFVTLFLIKRWSKTTYENRQ